MPVPRLLAQRVRLATATGPATAVRQVGIVPPVAANLLVPALTAGDLTEHVDDMLTVVLFGDVADSALAKCGGLRHPMR
jgi:hypothetical protein